MFRKVISIVSVVFVFSFWTSSIDLLFHVNLRAATLLLATAIPIPTYLKVLFSISVALIGGIAERRLIIGTGIVGLLSIRSVFIPNLSSECFNCLCYVSTKCDTSHQCTGGYCGPFNISRVYWVDAGRVTLPEDDAERNHAWEDCAREFTCAKRIIGGYLSKFGQDCNGDGVTNCFDYMMINGNGGYNCRPPLNRSANGRRWLKRFEECRRSIPSLE